MPKGYKLAPGEALVVYSTKLQPATRQLLNDLVTVTKANDPDYGHRELIEHMLQALQITQPALFERVGAMRRAIGGDPVPVMQITADQQRTEAAESRPDFTPPEPRENTVTTIQYAGKPTVHLEENGHAACGLSGQVDPDTVRLAPADTVDCKKCRFCRKKVFG